MQFPADITRVQARAAGKRNFINDLPSCISFVWIALFFLPSVVPAATPVAGAQAAPQAANVVSDTLSKLYSGAMAEFQAGDYQKAATDLESLISQASADSPLDTVYFTLGAAYFNLQNYPKAIEALTQYQKKYPKGARFNDAQFSIGQAQFSAKNYADAAASFKQLENDPKLRAKALFYEGSAYKEGGKLAESAAAFEKLVGKEITSTQMANSAITLATIYQKNHDPAKAIALLEKLNNNAELLDNIVRLNALAVELGDAMLQDHQPTEALTCYRLVRTRSEVIQFQNARQSANEKKIEQNLAALRADPSLTMDLLAENNQLRGTIADGKKQAEEFQKLPDFQPALLVRIGQAFYQMDRKWESIVAYDELLRRYPDAKERETALFGIIVSSAEASRFKQSHDYCEEYLKAFPQGANASAVGYLLGATALQSNDLASAETYFGRVLKEQPNSTFREEITFLLASTRFQQAKWSDAARDYQRYRTDFPNGSHAEEALYRYALCSFFAGKYEEAMKLVGDYISKYPHGAFIADAKYRYAMCKHAASLYDEVIADCIAWQKEFKNDPLSGEVFALEADALAASTPPKEDEAIDVYIRSYKTASTDQVLNYSLFAAQKLMQKKGQWEQIGNMFEEFVKERPEHPLAVTAVFWIGKAKTHEGKVDEAKQFVAATVKKYIADPKIDSVEQLLTQLAQLCVRKKKPAEPVATPTPSASPSAETAETAAASTPAPTPQPSPEAAPVDPGVELDQLLGGAETNQSPTAKARVLYAKSELARLRKQPAEQEKNFSAIAQNFKPDDLSPMLLAVVGDYLLSKGELDKAEPLFKRLMDDYAKNDIVEFAYNGLGEIAYRRKQYEVALKYYSDAIDKVGASQKLKDVTLGKAKSLLMLGKLDDAKKVFEQVASVREWRGDATACSVYSLGEILQKQGKLPEAIAQYQRVYVAYQKFLPWVAKAYAQSAECFEKLGKKEEAMNTYREMVRNEKLAKFPETEIARKRLQEAGQG